MHCLTYDIFLRTVLAVFEILDNISYFSLLHRGWCTINWNKLMSVVIVGAQYILKLFYARLQCAPYPIKSSLRSCCRRRLEGASRCLCCVHSHTHAWEGVLYRLLTAPHGHVATNSCARMLQQRPRREWTVHGRPFFQNSCFQARCAFTTEEFFENNRYLTIYIHTLKTICSICICIYVNTFRI